MADVSQWQIPQNYPALSFYGQISGGSGTSWRPQSSSALHFLLYFMDIILLASSYCDLELTLGLFVAKYGAVFIQNLMDRQVRVRGMLVLQVEDWGKSIWRQRQTRLGGFCSDAEALLFFLTQNKRWARGQDSQFTGQSSYQYIALIGSGRCFMWVKLVCSTGWLDCALLEKMKECSEKAFQRSY